MTKKYGIRIMLPPGDFLRGPHLLGEDWQGYRWFASEQDRDEAYELMQRRTPYYRRDEIPPQVLEKIEADA